MAPTDKLDELVQRASALPGFDKLDPTYARIALLEVSACAARARVNAGGVGSHIGTLCCADD